MSERRNISSGSRFEAEIGYARAVVHRGWVHVAGTTGFDYSTMTISDDVVEQAEQCVRNIGAALAEAGCTFADVVRVRYLFPDRHDFEPCFPTLRRTFGDVGPVELDIDRDPPGVRPDGDRDLRCAEPSGVRDRLGDGTVRVDAERLDVELLTDR